ncbi:hypothetical protein CLOM_g8430 [Closterium sp. NIES-68]|nr:hypothetical protein CLOM_g8430 [Closterium sp. NIES-68]GJP86574.1 hypothetical protein CLOP_g16581 [Closterium sp. NIES-67]
MSRIAPLGRGLTAAASGHHHFQPQVLVQMIHREFPLSANEAGCDPFGVRMSLDSQEEMGRMAMACP